MSKLVILSDEFLARIHVGLGEIQAKFAVPVIQEIQRLVDLAEQDYDKFKAEVDAHLKSKAPPAKVPAPELP
jgi:hypothetical protein